MSRLSDKDSSEIIAGIDTTLSSTFEYRLMVERAERTKKI